jgi:hypothetical protein
MDARYGDRLTLTVSRTRKLATLIEDKFEDGVSYGEMFEIDQNMCIAHALLSIVAQKLEVDMPVTVEEVLNMSDEDLEKLIKKNEREKKKREKKKKARRKK